MPEPLKPVIALSGKMTVEFKDGREIKLSSKSVLNMKAMLEKAGAEVVIIDPTRADPKNLSRFSGIVFMGNDNDIDPRKYGETKIHEKTKIETDAHTPCARTHMLNVSRANFEYQAMEAVLNLRMPMLGVCGGMQRLNVVCGGTLTQHVDGHWQVSKLTVPFKDIAIEKESVLSKIAGGKEDIWIPALKSGEKIGIRVNALHHQAVAVPGREVKISARSAEDGMVEAIELEREDHYAVGVQWHPEFMPRHPLSLGLITAMLEAALAYQACHPATA